MKLVELTPVCMYKNENGVKFMRKTFDSNSRFNVTWQFLRKLFFAEYQIFNENIINSLIFDEKINWNINLFWNLSLIGKICFLKLNLNCRYTNGRGRRFGG